MRDIVEVHVREGVQELSSDHLGVLLLFAATKYIRVGASRVSFWIWFWIWRPVGCVWGYARIRAGMKTRSGLTHGVVAEVQQRVEQLAAPEVRHHDVELAVLDKVLFDVHHVGVLQFFHHLDLVANLVDGDLAVLGCGARGGLHDFDGVFLARGLVHRAPHHRVPAGSEHRLHIVNVLDPARVFDARLRELPAEVRGGGSAGRRARAGAGGTQRSLSLRTLARRRAHRGWTRAQPRVTCASLGMSRKGGLFSG